MLVLMKGQGHRRLTDLDVHGSGALVLKIQFKKKKKKIQFSPSHFVPVIVPGEPHLSMGM